MCVYTSKYCMVCYPDSVKVYDNDKKEFVYTTDTAEKAQEFINCSKK